MPINQQNKFDVIIIGAGASGLMCAYQAGNRGKKVCIIDHSKKIASKVLISGGGRCNFTNLNLSSENYISKNKHFCKSALAQFSQYDFIDFIQKENIQYYEKEKGQLFCKNSSKDILKLLRLKCEESNVKIFTSVNIKNIDKLNNFKVNSSQGVFISEKLVIATGGLSYPKIGATDLGLKIAKKFGHEIIQTSPALVPYILKDSHQKLFAELAGLSLKVSISCKKEMFNDNLLFTHKGISGPAVLQISSYWDKNQDIVVNFIPNYNLEDFLLKKQQKRFNQELKTALGEILPKKLVKVFIEYGLIKNDKLKNLNNKKIEEIEEVLSSFVFKIEKTEGYNKAEVTKGGISTKQIDSKTMESKNEKGLYFIGEVLDITGQLGGYNLQWAWSSGYVAGNNI